MTHDDTTADYSADLEETLAEYERASEQGCPLDREAFLAAHPAIADALRPLLDAAELIDCLAAPVRKALASLPEEYEYLGELGHGGMGVVYRARQTEMERLVALKTIRPDWLAGLDEEGQRKAYEGFRREVQAAARLRHPSRVRIFHLGEHQGRPYYAMELIEGESLADKLKRGGIPTETVVRYLAGVAEALQEAHDRGIIHRDIKPANILIDRTTDQALLTDFGLARSPREETQVAGTLPYMSPEQIEGRADERSDVYSMGVTLYQALTGVLPFQGQTRDDLIKKICTDPPTPLHQHCQATIEMSAFLEQ